MLLLIGGGCVVLLVLIFAGEWCGAAAGRARVTPVGRDKMQILGAMCNSLAMGQGTNCAAALHDPVDNAGQCAKPRWYKSIGDADVP